MLQNSTFTILAPTRHKLTHTHAPNPQSQCRSSHGHTTVPRLRQAIYARSSPPPGPGHGFDLPPINNATHNHHHQHHPPVGHCCCDVRPRSKHSLSACQTTHSPGLLCPWGVLPPSPPPHACIRCTGREGKGGRLCTDEIDPSAVR